MKKLFILIALSFAVSLFSSETTFIIVRHGETDWNLQRRVQGSSNLPLNEHGIEQAKRLAEKMVTNYPDIAFIYSSDLDRAYATAQETAKKFHLEVEKSAAFRELHNGAAEGMDMEEKEILYGELEKELSLKYPDRKERWNFTPIPGAETMNSLLKRVKDELTAIANAHPGETIAVFAHGRVVKSLIADSTDANDIDLLPIFPHCGIAHFIYSEKDQEHPFQFVKVED